MRKLLIMTGVVGLALGMGLSARAAVSAWLDWVNEPLRQPPGLHLEAVARPPLAGARAGQTPAQATALPPTLAAPTPVPPTSTPQRTATPPSARTVATPRPATAAGTAVAGTVVPLSGQERRVTNTDGQGVALRDQPGGARLPAKGYDEGDVVTVLEQQGAWTHIRGRDGREGWVLSVTLAP